VVRQYIAYWKRNIRWDAKNPPFGDEQDTRTRGLLVDIQRVQGDDLVSVPGACYEVGIDWVDEGGVQMPRRTNAEWQHWVPKTAKPVGERINLTFRFRGVRCR